MPPECRAVVFDLDDTIYPYRRFTLSGFAHVARHLERACQLDARLGFSAMVGASRGIDRGREIQACLAQHDLPIALAAELIDLLRHHQPRLRLPRAAARALSALRRDGWRIGVLTNGQPSIQRRKVDALGLAPHVDAIVYAAACGRGLGKPEPEAFAEIARQIQVPARRTVFVGDDERCDVQGAIDAGMRAVRCRMWTRADGLTAAAASVDRLTQIPAVAHALLEEAPNRHAA
jgi:putative hydrolase of the HAD superfamily